MTVQQASVGFSQTQRARLGALGLVPMVRRDTGEIRPDPADAPHAHAVAGAAAPEPIRIGIAGCGTWPPRDAEARLVDDLLASLGLTIAQVQWASDGALPEGVPVLAFGPEAPAGVLRLPALSRLRDALEKRIAWPQLRNLRRQLRKANP